MSYNTKPGPSLVTVVILTAVSAGLLAVLIIGGTLLLGRPAPAAQPVLKAAPIAKAAPARPAYHETPQEAEAWRKVGEEMQRQANLKAAEPQGFSSPAAAPAAAVQAPEPAPAPGRLRDDLSVEDLHYWPSYDSFSGGKVTGYLVNHGSRLVSYGMVEFNLYDHYGTQVGSTMANINNLEPGGRWRFEAIAFQSSAAAAKLTGIVAW